MYVVNNNNNLRGWFDDESVEKASCFWLHHLSPISIVLSYSTLPPHFPRSSSRFEIWAAVWCFEKQRVNNALFHILKSWVVGLGFESWKGRICWKIPVAHKILLKLWLITVDVILFYYYSGVVRMLTQAWLVSRTQPVNSGRVKLGLLGFFYYVESCVGSQALRFVCWKRGTPCSKQIVCTPCIH